MANVGEMKHEITILYETVNTDSDGFDIKTWKAFRTVWAAVKDLSGRSFYALNAEQQTKAITCVIWYRTDINESMRVKFRDEIYRIKRIYQGTYDNKQMSLDCELIKGIKD